jgi:hypothetical protein
MRCFLGVGISPIAFITNILKEEFPSWEGLYPFCEIALQSGGEMVGWWDGGISVAGIQRIGIRGGSNPWKTHPVLRTPLQWRGKYCPVPDPELTLAR